MKNLRRDRMAGYIMTLDSLESLKNCIRTGTYSTNLSEPIGSWKAHHEGTFADFLSMKDGDNIYFFIKRKLYGIGKITNIAFDCKFLNYEGADIPNTIGEQEYIKKEPLLPNATENNRCFCTFKPAPFYFENGIDMDEALSSNPNAYRMLRAMWKVSFIKIDDNENKALMDVILKKNEENLLNKSGVFDFKNDIHEEIANRVSDVHRLTSKNILLYASHGEKIKHEMAIEAALCERLISSAEQPFGKWDYVSHQVVASPFKAIDYMDKMDVFGYRFIDGFSTISKYLVVEIKKDDATVDAIEQTMKYVDWIQKEYAHGDYSMIEAYIVASDYSDEVIQKRNKECIRYFTKGFRPSESCIWNSVKLIRYIYNQCDRKIEFVEI